MQLDVLTGLDTASFPPTAGDCGKAAWVARVVASTAAVTAATETTGKMTRKIRRFLLDPFRESAWSGPGASIRAAVRNIMSCSPFFRRDVTVYVICHIYYRIYRG